jgi:hypothetical protein
MYLPDLPAIFAKIEVWRYCKADFSCMTFFENFSKKSKCDEFQNEHHLAE